MRIMIAVSLILAALLPPTGVAFAAPAQKPAGFCNVNEKTVSLPMTPAEIDNYIRTTCQPGDVIWLPRGSTFLMAQDCDFTHTVVSGSEIVCIYAGERQKR